MIVFWGEFSVFLHCGFRGFSFCIPGDWNLLASFLSLFWEPKSFLLEEKMKASVSCGGLGLAGGTCPPGWAAPPAALQERPWCPSCPTPPRTAGTPVSPHTAAQVRSER